MINLSLAREPRLHKGERIVSSTNSAGKNSIYMQKNEIGSLFCNIHRFNSKWIKYLNMKSETVKLLRENIGERIHDTGFDHDFFG